MAGEEQASAPSGRGLGGLFKRRNKTQSSSDNEGGERSRHPQWTMGILNDPKTVEVPGMTSSNRRRRPTPMLIHMQDLFCS